jgi:hypothetical protein
LPFDLPPDNETPYFCTSTKPRVYRWGLNRSWYLGRNFAWKFARQQIRKNWEIKVNLKLNFLSTKCNVYATEISISRLLI